MKSTAKIWRWFFVMAALEAGAAFVVLLAVPHGGGYSAARLGVLLVLLAMALGATFLAARLPAGSDWRASGRSAIAAGLLAVVAAVALFLLRYLDPGRLLVYYERLSPLLWCVVLLAAQAAVFILIVCYGADWERVRAEHSTWVAATTAFAGLLVLFGFVVVTRMGLTPDSAYWAEPGVPVFAWQLGLALVVAAAIFIVGLRYKLPARTDIAVAAAIWLLAVGIWLSVPGSVMKNSFYAPINPPTNQSLPNSDVGYYDSMAHSLIIGYPYQGDIPTRPLYVVFLSALHALLGERYDLIVAGQTLLLALIPVVLYVLGKRLHSRAAGIVAALFAIFREWNSLLISSQTRVSNTRTLLVDLPTLLLLLVACVFVLRWLQRRGYLDALLAGGLLGLLLLLRTQTLLVLPVILVLALLAYGVRNPRLLPSLGWWIAGVALAMAPWLLHNYLHSGQITLDVPFEYQVIASQYRYTGNLDLGAVDLQGKGLAGLLLTFALKDPGFVAGFIGSHFMATLVDSALALPLAAEYKGLLAPINLYWMDWPAHVDALNAALLIPYMAIIALGLGAAWKRLRWAGLTPLAFALAYAAANGIGRFSGWRYDLPADWVAYFYLAVGAAELFRFGATFFGAKPVDAPAPTSSVIEGRRFPRSAASVGAILILAGALPWLAEGAAAPRYANDTLPVLMNTLSSAPAVEKLGVDHAQIASFIAAPQTTLQIGQVMYPRFFLRDDGLSSSHPWPSYAPRDFARVGFLLLNQSRHDALMPVRQLNAGFEQGANAVILGCQRQDYIEVRLILFPETGAAYLAAPLSQGCQ